MKQTFVGGLGSVLCVLCACGDDGGGGGGGGGGGIGTFTFARGFAYVRKDDRNVYLADEVDFQQAGKLTTAGGASSPALSADGKTLVYVEKVGTGTRLLTVSTAGGTPTVLFTSDAQHSNFKQPVFSPDGKTVAFSYDEGSAGAVGAIDVAGTNFRKLVGGGALGYALPAFTSDGTALIAAAGSTGVSLSQVERIDLSTGLTTNITNTLGTEAMTIFNRLALSPNGTKLAFDARVGSGVTRIFVMDLDTKVVTKANDYMNEPGTNDSFPTWVDSSTVAYSSDSGGNDNVYTVGITGIARKLQVPTAVEPWYAPPGT